MDLSAKARVFISIKDDGGSEDIILWVDSQELDKIEVAEIKRRIQDETGILATNIELFMDDMMGSTDQALQDSWVGSDLDLEEDSHLIAQIKDSTSTPSNSDRNGGGGQNVLFEYESDSDGEREDEYGAPQETNQQSNITSSLSNLFGSTSISPSNPDILATDHHQLGGHGNNHTTNTTSMTSSSDPFYIDVSDFTVQNYTQNEMLRFSDLEKRLLWRLALRDAFTSAEEKLEQMESSDLRFGGNTGRSGRVGKRMQEDEETGYSDLSRLIPISILGEEIFNHYQIKLLILEDNRRKNTVEDIIGGVSDNGLRSEASWEDLITFLQKFESSRTMKITPEFQRQLFPSPIRKILEIVIPSTQRKLQVDMISGVSAEIITKNIMETSDLNIHPSDEPEILHQIQNGMVQIYQEELKVQRDSWNLFRRVVTTSEDLLLRYEERTSQYADQEKESERSTRKAMASSSTSDGSSFSVGRGSSGTVVSKLGRQIMDTKIRIQEIDSKIEEMKKKKKDLEDNPPQVEEKFDMDESPRDDNDVDDERPGSSSMKEKQAPSDLNNEFAFADTDGDGEISREEWNSWVSEKNRMAEQAEENRKSLLAENRRLRNTLEEQPDSFRLERRLRLWEEEKNGMLNSIANMKEEWSRLDADLRAAYEELDVIRSKRQEAMMEGTFEGEYFDDSGLYGSEVNSEDFEDEEFEDDEDDDENVENEMMNEFWMSLPKDQLLKRWGQEVSEIGQAHSLTMKELERERNMLLDKLSAYQHHF